MDIYTRDYLWAPLYKLLEAKKIKTVLNLGGGTSKEWIDIVQKYQLTLDVVDEYEGHGSTPDNINSLRAIIDTKLDSNCITIIKADALSYEFLQQKYDLIYARNSLHHIIPHGLSSIEQQNDLFKKLYATIRDNGYIYIREVGRINLPYYLRPLFPKIFIPMSYKTKNNVNEWIQMLKNAGFIIVDKKYYVPRKVCLFRPLLANALANPFLTSAYMILGTKPSKIL